MKVPFIFALTDADEYGTPFAAADDAFGSTAELNGVLASIVAASQAYSVYGITVPPTSAAYKILGVYGLKSSDTDDDIEFGLWNGSAFIKLYNFVTPNGLADFSFTVNVPAGYIPAFRYPGNTSASVSGQIEWGY